MMPTKRKYLYRLARDISEQLGIPVMIVPNKLSGRPRLGVALNYRYLVLNIAVSYDKEDGTPQFDCILNTVDGSWQDVKSFFPEEVKKIAGVCDAATILAFLRVYHAPSKRHFMWELR